MTEPVQNVPAIGVSFVANLNERQQLTFQTYFGRDEDDATANEILDRFVRLASRQAAAAEIEGIEAEIRRHEQALQQYQEDFERLEREFAVKDAKANVEMEELNRQATETFELAYQEHADSGRQTEFTPKGHVAARLKQFDAARAKAREDREKMHAERNVACANLDISRKRYLGEIERLKGELAKRRAIIGV